ncbi:MAG: hypothetical protein SF028_11720 [Candidatus Sumerlaeia bacterium]|nr:hypothetical protein [Candidatus Sumerlaeia bacterium]
MPSPRRGLARRRGESSLWRMFRRYDELLDALPTHPSEGSFFPAWLRRIDPFLERADGIALLWAFRVRRISWARKHRVLRHLYLPGNVLFYSVLATWAANVGVEVHHAMGVWIGWFILLTFAASRGRPKLALPLAAAYAQAPGVSTPEVAMDLHLLGAKGSNLLEAAYFEGREVWRMPQQHLIYVLQPLLAVGAGAVRLGGFPTGWWIFSGGILLLAMVARLAQLDGRIGRAHFRWRVLGACRRAWRGAVASSSGRAPVARIGNLLLLLAGAVVGAVLLVVTGTVTAGLLSGFDVVGESNPEELVLATIGIDGGVLAVLLLLAALLVARRERGEAFLAALEEADADYEHYVRAVHFRDPDA